MAQLFSRGTLTRTRWDYFESSNGWASVFGSVATGGINCFFANNATNGMQLDIYGLQWFASTSIPWNVFILVPPFVLTEFAPTEVEVHATQLDKATPPGVCGMFNANTSPAYTIQRISSAVDQGVLAPVGGMCFITLPPNYGIGVGGGVSAPTELAMSVWYQEVLDNVSPAR